MGHAPADESPVSDERAAARPAKRFRTESFFLPVCVAVMIGSVWLASRPDDDAPVVAMPDFSLPGIELEIPFTIELSGEFAPFERSDAPRLALGHDTEGVIEEVREALLVSSRRTGSDVERPTPELAAGGADTVEQVAAR